ncbi:MAG: SPOR domain-containing protein [Balneolaceae bacterium]
MKNLLIILTVITFSILHACATTEPITESENSEKEDIESILELPAQSYEEYVDIDRLNEDEKLLYENRSQLSDLFATRSHDMPDVFLREVEEKEEEVDIYAGFRIQILSTRDMELADSTQINFNAWADTTFQEHTPRAYIFFRQPFYRVRVGDFHDRERAIEFSRKIKFRYSDAWVVHDRINPFRVPADTVKFRMVN